MNNEIKYLTDLMRGIMLKFIAREKKPHDYGNGELLYRFESHVIDIIGHNPGINIIGIAAKMNVTKGAISQAVNKLVAKKYVIKTRDISNRRQIMLSLTKKGERIFIEHDKFHAEINLRFLEKFVNFSKNEKAFIKDLLETVNKSLDT